MIDLTLYWNFPTPRRFLDKLASIDAGVRVIGLNKPLFMPTETWHSIQKAIPQSIAFPLFVRDHTNLSVDIGHHFKDGRPISASELAHATGIEATSIFLQQKDEEGWKLAEAYVLEFLAAINEGKIKDCPVRIFIDMHDEAHKFDASDGSFCIVAFDGGLTLDEMESYVSLRMLDKRYDARAPSASGEWRLVQDLIASFAGYDPELAERLMGLEPGKILFVLEQLSGFLDEAPLRWTSTSWLNATSNSRGVIHPLRLQYLRLHGTETEKKVAEAALKKLYWRGCIKSITPWLEEIRPKIVRVLDRQLRKASQTPGGKLGREVGGKWIDVAVEDAEFGSIAFLDRKQYFNGLSELEYAAVQVCHAVTSVRNDITHLRAPQASAVDNMVRNIRAFDTLNTR